MAAEITEITDSNQAWFNWLYGYLHAMNAKLDQIITDQARMETELRALMGAWSAGGLRGLRHRAASFAARPDPDGSRAAFLADGLATLEAHHEHE